MVGIDHYGLILAMVGAGTTLLDMVVIMAILIMVITITMVIMEDNIADVLLLTTQQDEVQLMRIVVFQI